MFPKVKCTGYLAKSKKPKSYLKELDGCIAKICDGEEEEFECGDFVTNESYELKECNPFLAFW